MPGSGGNDFSRERLGSLMFSGGAYSRFSNLRRLLCNLKSAPPLFAEELTSQLAEFAFFDTSDFDESARGAPGLIWLRGRSRLNQQLIQAIFKELRLPESQSL
jgi:hypothetical protein